MDLKIIFLIILGIITSILICKIVHQKLYGVEGAYGLPWDPIGDAIDEAIAPIKKAINDVINGVNVIFCFVLYIITILEWFVRTIACIVRLFIPPCPFFHILDIIIAFVGFVLKTLLELLGLGMLVTAFSIGCDGINFVTNAAFGVEIFDFHEWMGIKPLCYDPNFAFRPFPKFEKPDRIPYI